MSDQKFSENIAKEDIKAEVEKTNSRLIFSGIVLFMVLVGFWVRSCSKMPPALNDSVECTKVGGQWVPKDYKIVKDELAKEIDAYCSLKKEIKP